MYILLLFLAEFQLITLRFPEPHELEQLEKLGLYIVVFDAWYVDGGAIVKTFKNLDKLLLFVIIIIY